MALRYIDELSPSEFEELVNGKRVLVRFDFNVPLKDGVITDTTRVDLALETIKYILAKKPKKLVLMSHLGRPKGKIDPKYSLEPVAVYLAEKLGQDVLLTETCLDSNMKTLLELKENQIILLENLRYHEGEEKNDKDFARSLASYGDIYVNDAFGAVHRKHASVYGINAFFKKKAFGGLLLKREVLALEKIIESPKRPFVAIVGGAKIADKIKVLDRLLTNVQTLLIGGAMAYPFLKAQGHEVGLSKCDDEDVALAKRILSRSESQKIVLPIDHIVADNPDASASSTERVEIPKDKMALDIGKHTIDHFRSKLMGAHTVFWNGPMGFFEKSNFAQGTFEIARILSRLPDAFTLVGGGDSVSAVNKSGMSDKISHISTGGGASLEFIEQGSLPGIFALKFGIDY